MEKKHENQTGVMLGQMNKLVEQMGKQNNSQEPELKMLTPSDAKMPSEYVIGNQKIGYQTLSATNCIDGETPGKAWGLCHTMNHSAPWLALVFEEPVAIQKVVLYNRQNPCCAGLLKNVQI